MSLAEFAVFLSGVIGHFYGTFAGGGAFLTIPALIFVGFTPQIAIATNRLATFGMVLGRLPTMWNRLNLGWKLPLFLILVETAGAFIGANLLLTLDPTIIFNVIGFLMLFGALLTFLLPSGQATKELKEITNKNIAITAFFLFFLGIYAGFFGPGSGTLGILILTNILGLSFIQTVAFGTYSQLANVIVVSTIFYQAGYINFVFAFILGFGIFLGAHLSTKLAVLKGNLFVKNIFIALSIIFGIYFIFFR